MPISFGTNQSSLVAQRELSKSSGSLSRSFERLSSGQRINRAADDAAGLSIADTLRSNARVYSQGLRNLNDGISALNIADSSVEALTDITIRIQELAAQAANGSFSPKQREALDKEAQQLGKEYFRIARTTTFNNLNLFDGSFSTLSIQAGFGSNGSIGAQISGVMGNGTLTSSTTYAIEASSGGLAVFDLNNDGFQDVVTGGASTQVRLGNGDGTLRGPVTYSMVGSGSVIATDINNDGIADLVATGSTGRMSWMLGVGDGTFGAVRSVAVANAAYKAAAGDFNGDGKIDIATSGGIILGNGDGSFQSPTAVSIGISGDVVANDFNNDGILDLAVANDGGSSIAIVLGRGNGTFGTALTYTTTDVYQYGIRAGDLNGDGKMDLVTAGYDSSDGIIRIFLGRGDGTFSTSQSYATIHDRHNNDVALADLDGNGTLDIVAGGRDGGAGAAVQIFSGNGDGTFRGQATMYLPPSGNEVLSLATGDLNGDGAPDFVLNSNSTSGGQILLSNTRAGTAPLLPFSLATVLDAKAAMTLMSQKLTQLQAQRGSIGVLQSRLSSASNTLDASRENSLAAESRVRDVDIASESSEVVRLKILNEATAAALAQANRQPSITLQLLS